MKGEKDNRTEEEECKETRNSHGVVAEGDNELAFTDLSMKKMMFFYGSVFYVRKYEIKCDSSKDPVRTKMNKEDEI